jgi:predicted ester cyclase
MLTRLTWTGTHKSNFLGVPAAGHQVSVSGMALDRLESGKIKETRILMDALGLMQQLGCVTFV